MLVETIQSVYGAAGVKMSLNDTIRHLIRRGGIVLAHTPQESEDAVRTHCETCQHCEFSATKFRCPEGLYLYRNHRRVARAHAGSGVKGEL